MSIIRSRADIRMAGFDETTFCSNAVPEICLKLFVGEDLTKSLMYKAGLHGDQITISHTEKSCFILCLLF